MNVCLDVDYRETSSAQAAAVAFRDWTDVEGVARCVCTSELPPAAYRPGELYRRELPPLLNVLEALRMRLDEPMGVLVVDAYCQLDAHGRPGLGAHLSAALGGRLPIVGVAKSRYRDTTHAAEVLRGRSRRPLFVTAVGLDLDLAARLIFSMAGPHRLPTLLKDVDRLARTGGRSEAPQGG
ncbi:MAG: endonuclease V [Acidobacteriota bacterium]